ncbi:hypothetical protein [Streptomyces ochraceiscleroticus]|uniref:Gram-positive cocci surface proteins LPxTG domain-containing protein n=1 Tax=Streptomyces ochraceiscleroticus TaxID=47761 RepID=A0ABW1MFJ7_9ACTN|nr:hypothetical protein [Streptomyces ochraceiscleroticus]
MTARRPLVTAAAAGSVLIALCFVPSANATAEHDDGMRRSAVPAVGQDVRAGTDTAAGAGQQGRVAPGTQVAAGTDGAQGTGEVRLADSGSLDTTPYAVGGTAFLGIGAALVTLAVRRSRGETA